MTERKGHKRFDKDDADNCVDIAFWKLNQTVNNDAKFVKPVVLRDFIEPSSSEDELVTPKTISLGLMHGLGSLRRTSRCSLNKKSEHYKVRCSVSFDDLHCTLPRVNDTIDYVLSIKAEGNINFRLHRGAVQNIILVLPTISYAMSVKNTTTKEDAILSSLTVPSSYALTGDGKIQGLYTHGLRYFLTLGAFFGQLDSIFHSAPCTLTAD
ncbi:hypothetical protein V5799_006914 [Amblyomma americanum]|uniref:Uncharacterized protein n=1 Tax=Amblyomma americanum TaxID=6943 RepID=A0AAQ4DV18_AMBAM